MANMRLLVALNGLIRYGPTRSELHCSSMCQNRARSLASCKPTCNMESYANSCNQLVVMIQFLWFVIRSSYLTFCHELHESCFLGYLIRVIFNQVATVNLRRSMPVFGDIHTVFQDRRVNPSLHGGNGTCAFHHILHRQMGAHTIEWECLSELP